MKQILSELYSIMREPPRSQFERTDEETAAIVYMAASSIQNGDLWSLVTKTNIMKYFEEIGLTEKDLNSTIRMNDTTFKQQGYVREEIDGKTVFVPVYIPTLGIRLLGQAYLERHPEMKDVVKH